MILANQDLRFDTFHIDKNSYAIMGSGKIFYLDTNNILKTFSNTFYKTNDSISWGEPGVILTYGKWRRKDKIIIAEHRLIERTFSLTGEVMAKTSIDTFKFNSDTLIANNNEKFIPIGPLTAELKTFLNSDWSKIGEKNGH